jgi:hypothetical protein
MKNSEIKSLVLIFLDKNNNNSNLFGLLSVCPGDSGHLSSDSDNVRNNDKAGGSGCSLYLLHDINARYDHRSRSERDNKTGMGKLKF